MNTKTSRVISLFFGVALLGGLSRPCLAAGDRNLDTNVVYPAGALVQNGGRVINMKSPPAGTGIVAATGNGITDDTRAFLSVYNFIKHQYVRTYTMYNQTPFNSSYIIYIPNGTYRVTQSLIYSGTAPVYRWPGGCDINNLRLIGQSRAGTVIKLDSNLAAFQSKSNPMPVIRYQHPSTPFNNIATSNLCENLTVNVGSGNPGAVAIQFQGANSARMANVRLTSGDGGGLYGLWFPVGSVQAYLKDITITGFDNAVCSVANAENTSAFEHLTCTNQHVAAISVLGGGVTLRDMVSNQGAYHVPAVEFSKEGGSVVLLDSQLNGGSSTAPAVVITRTKQDLFARNTSVSGYSVAVQNQGTAVVSGSFISEYCAYPVTTLFAGQDTHSYAMAVQDTPETPWETNLSNWVNVEDYRRGKNSDDATIQAAFAAAAAGSKTVVYFPRVSYTVKQAINVPACVRRVDFMFTICMGKGGVFKVGESSPNPVTFVGKLGYTQIAITAPRTVVGLQVSGDVINTQSAPITTFTESCANMGDGNQFCTSNQTVYARCINDEDGSGSGDIVATSGSLWILGFKTENKPVPALYAPGGGVAEVLGGYVNCVANPHNTPMIKNSNSSICLSGFTNMNQTFPVVISETRDLTVATASNTRFPVRGGGYPGNFDIPLYVGGPRPSGPFGQFQRHQDIGSVAAAGSANCYDDATGTYFIDGSGIDIWNNVDSFQFVDSTWNGDGEIIANVNSVDNTNDHAKSGVMFRDGTSANGMFVDMVVTNSQGVWMQARTSAGADAVTAGKNTSLRPPYWVKLRRTGASSFIGSVSADGKSWTQLGTTTVNIPSTACAGLCVTSHVNNGTLCRSIMSDVSLSRPR